MKFLTLEETESWCEAHGLTMAANRFPFYNSEDASLSFSIGIEEKPSRLINLLGYLIPVEEDVHFKGALLWIRERNIWDDHSETLGAMIEKQMRKGCGETASIEDKPACLFSQDELLELESFCVVPMLFGWDAFLIPADQRDYFIYISHDGIIEITGHKSQGFEQIKQGINDWDSNRV